MPPRVTVLKESSGNKKPPRRGGLSPKERVQVGEIRADL